MAGPHGRLQVPHSSQADSVETHVIAGRGELCRRIGLPGGPHLVGGISLQPTPQTVFIPSSGVEGWPGLPARAALGLPATLLDPFPWASLPAQCSTICAPQTPPGAVVAHSSDPPTWLSGPSPHPKDLRSPVLSICDSEAH